MDAQGFLGTNASFTSDLTLMAYIFLLVPGMLIGFFFARRKWFEPHHKLTMTSIALLNWVLIIFVMIVSFTRSVAPEIPQGLSQPAYLLPALHALTGITAQILATYIVIRMWGEKIIRGWAWAANIKIWMRTTLALWLITAALGIAIYFTWYGGSAAPTGDNVTPPVATEEVDAQDAAPAETPEAGG